MKSQAKEKNNSFKSHLPKKRQTKPKWFETQITTEQFETRKDKKGKFYGHHEAWKNNTWIGPYDNEDELNKVIASYVSVSKKPFGKRKELKNVHSIVIEKQEWV